MSVALPKSFVEWEKVLCDHFLASSDGETSPIRSIEVTPAMLVEAFHGNPAQSEEAVDSFRSALDINKVCAALEHGHYQAFPKLGLPGSCSYLALTLLVDSLIEEDVELYGAFRSKLAAFLEIDRAFSNLTGIATMWVELKAWLDDKVKSGEPYKRLVLPDPGFWTHIGYTVRLSFPSRRDKRLMHRFLEANPNLTASPDAFMSAFRSVAADPGTSWGMRDAFEEFHSDFLSGRRALGNHRFWALVQALASGQKSAAVLIGLSIELTKDQDDAWVYSCVAVGSQQTKRDHFQALDQAVAAASELVPHELARAIGKGFIVFRQIGHARWRAAAGITECVGRVMVGVAPEISTKIGRSLGKLAPSGTWFLTEHPVSIGAAEKALDRLGGGLREEDRIVSVSVRDGIRSGAFWLGRRRFLPQIAADSTELVIRAESGAKGEIRSAEISDAPGTFSLTADQSVDGRFVVAPKADLPAVPAWSRRLTFVADALIHASDEQAAQGRALIEWDDVEQLASAVGSFDPIWEDSKPEVDDLIEAIYAGGKSGWNESELVQTVRDGLGAEINPWDVLRCLQESTLLNPLLRSQWKGKIWSLVPPSLVAVRYGDRDVYVVRGCLCERLIDEFTRGVAGAGGAAFRRAGVSPLSPMLFGFVDADPDRLTEKLGWSMTAAVGPRGRTLAFQLTARRPNRYLVAHRWCWTRGRFVPPEKAAEDPVMLARLCHPGGRDHDIYLVTKDDKEFHLLSRSAAIVLAHSLRETPLFRVSEGHLHRLRAEGNLPDAIVTGLRLAHLANPGPDKNDYIYLLNASEIAALTRLVPHIVANIDDSASRANSDAINLSIHSGGRIRTIWKKGNLSTTHS